MANGNTDPTKGQDSLEKAVRRNLSPARLRQLAERAAVTVKTRGWQALFRAGLFRWNLATGGEVWQYRVDTPLAKDLRAQRKTEFGVMPLVSVLVPLYKTPPEFLRQMIESVLRQSYANFELVLADGSGPAHSEVAAIVAKYAQKDPRVRLIRLYKNAGISANTGAAIAESRGELMVLLDHDDALAPHALFCVVKAHIETGADLLYSDEVVLDEKLKRLCEYHLKPDYSPDYLNGCNYITHLCAFTYKLLKSAGEPDPHFDGAQDYDLILRLAEKAAKVHHIREVLYYWRRHGGSTAGGMDQKPRAVDAGRRAIAAHLERVGLDGDVTALPAYPGAYRVAYTVWGRPKVSVVIPSSDHIDDLALCLSSLYANAGWDNFEVLVIDNNSSDPATESFYEGAVQEYENLTVLRYATKGEFNFSALCNFGVSRAFGEHILLLNNDIEVTSPGFLREMLSYSQRTDVGAVGALLYYPDGKVQHAGLIVGIGGTAGVSHKGLARGNGGHMYRLAVPQDYSAVTGAALMVKKALYEAMNGLDETDFAVGLNDVDFCLRLGEAGLWNVFTPHAVGTHYESKSRGFDEDGETRSPRYAREIEALHRRHPLIFEQGDPFYNPRLTLKYENYALR